MSDQKESAKPSDDDELVTEEKKTFFESTLFRWITLALYLSGVSGMGMCLSLYYLLFFDSTMPEIYLRFPVTVPDEDAN